MYSKNNQHQISHLLEENVNLDPLKMEQPAMFVTWGLKIELKRKEIISYAITKIYNLSKAITTPAREAIALDIPINSVAEILVFAGGSWGTIISAPGYTLG